MKSVWLKLDAIEAETPLGLLKYKYESLMSTSNALKKYSIYVSRVIGNSTFSFTKFNKIYILADLCLKINFRNSAFQGKNCFPKQWIFLFHYFKNSFVAFREILLRRTILKWRNANISLSYFPQWNFFHRDNKQANYPNYPLAH